AARGVPSSRAAPRGPVQLGFVRRWVRRAVPACAVVVSALSTFADCCGRVLLRLEPRVIALAIPVAAAGRAHRLDPDDGLHPRAGESAADCGRVHANATADAALLAAPS